MIGLTQGRGAIRAHRTTCPRPFLGALVPPCLTLPETRVQAVAATCCKPNSETAAMIAAADAELDQDTCEARP